MNARRGDLIESRLPLVRAIAARFVAAGEPLEDLVQVGAIGLIKAVDRFDPLRGVPLDAFAAPVIAGEIRHHLRDRCQPLRVPRRAQAEGFRVVAVPLEDAGPLRSGGEPVPHRALPSSDPIAGAGDRVALAAALRALPPRDRRIVLLRYAADLSQAQIAARLGLSQVTVSRVLRIALGTLRTQLG